MRLSGEIDFLPPRQSVKNPSADLQEFTADVIRTFLELLSKYDEQRGNQDDINARIGKASSEIQNRLQHVLEQKRTIVQDQERVSKMLLHSLVNQDNPMLHQYISAYMAEAVKAAGIEADKKGHHPGG